MARLREVTEALGCQSVSTFGNSGNVLLSSSLSPTELESALTVAYTSEFGFDIDTVVRSLPQLLSTLARAPFPDGDPAQVTVHFLTGEVPDDLHDRLTRTAVDGERVHVADVRPVAEFFVDFGLGVARSKLANRMPRIVQPALATARNVRTLATVAGLLAGAAKAGFGPAVTRAAGEPDD